MSVKENESQKKARTVLLKHRNNEDLHLFFYLEFICMVLTVRSTLMGRPNWSQITKQAGFKQALLRACFWARFTIPKEQGGRSRTGDMAAQFLDPG
jgi:hypothetical protein